MANHSCGRRQSSPPSQAGLTKPPVHPEPPVYHPEPEVRRWPHPTAAPAPEQDPRQADSVLYYLSCSLSYQNQLLADIKTLLQELQASQEEK